MSFPHVRLSHSRQSASEEEQLLVAPLTSGNWSLDQALETHLDICSIILEVETLHPSHYNHYAANQNTRNPENPRSR